MLTPTSLAELREVSIYDVIHPHVPLKRAGGGKFIACCPFHNEKTPSFSVNAERNMFKCFGCGEGGNSITFLRRLKKLDFLEAAEQVAEIGGIRLERDKNFNQEQYEQQKQERKGLQQLMDECAARYTAQLWQPDCPALPYLTDERGYDRSSISAWRLGYAAGDNTLARHYFSSGDLPELVKIGLVAEGENNYYDALRDRVLFPILNERGEVCGFGGRDLSGKAKAKYVNPPTTPLYDKSKMLYGLYQAAKGIKELKFATLTEGYTDVISLHRAGLTNAVASCGTALTAEQCVLLKRYTDRVLLMRDGDEAGMKATSRDIPLLLRHGFAVDVLQLEPGQDPDNFAKQFITP